LQASADDLLRFLSAQLGEPHTLLEEAMRLTQEIQGEPDARGGGQGLAWGTVVFPGEAPVVGHTGSTVGFRSQIAFQPERDIGVVLLTNDYAFDETELTSALLYMDPVPDSWSTATVPAQVLARFAGEYRRVENRGAMYIRLEEEGWLTYQIPEKVRARLYPRSDSTFFMLRGPWTLTFHTQSGGSTTVTMVIDEREPGSVGSARELQRVSEETPRPLSVAGHAGVGLPGGVGVWLIGCSCLGALGLATVWWRTRSGAAA